MLSFHCTMANWKKMTHEERLAKRTSGRKITTAVHKK
ncbi:unnamed protein product [Callosobruchus maculatus]|uniref:Uncharacterized protein n=1 Tax=Callosobruchus maculatus TaxID=64391 RepID=A0A653DMU8_CALMS|nr:unnamed protein product [Callosobruchus maculatus]